MVHTSFIYDRCVRGYHELLDISIWDASVGEILHCSCEVDNPNDDHAVAVIRYHWPHAKVCQRRFFIISTATYVGSR